MYKLDIANLKQNEWNNVREEKLYAVVDQSDRGPYVQVVTQAEDDDVRQDAVPTFFMFPDRNCREVSKGELVHITKVCPKKTYAFFRSVPVSEEEINMLPENVKARLQKHLKEVKSTAE